MYRLVFKHLLAWIQILRNPTAYARSLGVEVGERCRFLALKPTTFGSEPYLVRLGDHVTLTSGVKFVTHDGGVWVFRNEHPDIDVFGPISVGSNVFIGVDSLIMPSVNIGSNVVIGAGSVVTRDIPSNSVAVGVPARVIRPLGDYREKVLANATFVRSQPPAVKKRLLQERFFGDNGSNKITP